MLHECVSSTMSNRFTVAFILPQIFDGAKISREFSTTMTCSASFFGIAKAWFIHPVGYIVRCRGNCLGYRFVYIDDGLPCDSTSLKCTRYHKINELVEHVVKEIVSCNKR